MGYDFSDSWKTKKDVVRDCPQDLVNMVPPAPAKSFMFSVKWRAMRVEARP
jgi:hypothetical protein